MHWKQTLAATAMFATIAFTTGCHVDEHKHGNREDVKIDTPFGNMSVKTNGTSVAAETGIDVYPGAQPITKKDKDGDNGAADVNMSFGKFTLRVRAASYRTSDAPDKVIAFYKAALAKFAPVIECSHDQPVGSPSQTPEGLTCSDSHDRNIPKHHNATDEIQLKTGSKRHQHVVEVEPEGSGAKFGLVELELPGGDSADDADNNDAAGKPRTERKQ